MMFPDTWDDVKRRKNNCFEDKRIFVFQCVYSPSETLVYGLGKPSSRHNCYEILREIVLHRSEPHRTEG